MRDSPRQASDVPLCEPVGGRRKGEFSAAGGRDNGLNTRDTSRERLAALFVPVRGSLMPTGSSRVPGAATLDHQEQCLSSSSSIPLKHSGGCQARTRDLDGSAVSVRSSSLARKSTASVDVRKARLSTIEEGGRARAVRFDIAADGNDLPGGIIAVAEEETETGNRQAVASQRSNNLERPPVSGNPTSGPGCRPTAQR